MRNRSPAISEETKRWARRQRIHQLLLFTETGSGSCSMACSYCFLAKRGENKVMARETLFRAIDFLREIAVGPPSLHFFGTEPLKRFDLIVAAREYAPNMPISLTTNGHLLSDKRIRWLNDNDVKIYVFSLDGGPEHNAARVDRKGNPTWPIVTRNLRKLLETEQAQWLTVRATWWPSDYDLVSRFKALMDLGASSIQIVPVTEARFDEERVMRAYLELGEFFDWGWTPSRFINDMIKRVQQEDTIAPPGNACGVGSNYWAVSPDGKLSLCQLYEEHQDVGGIGDVWNGITNPLPLLAIGDRVDTFHTSANPYPKQTPTYDCSRCHAYRHCMNVGWCAGIHRLATGDELVPPDGYCAHTRGMVAAARIWARKMAERAAARMPADRHGVLGLRVPVAAGPPPTDVFEGVEFSE